MPAGRAIVLSRRPKNTTPPHNSVIVTTLASETNTGGAPWGLEATCLFLSGVAVSVPQGEPRVLVAEDGGTMETVDAIGDEGGDMWSEEALER